MIDLGAFDLTKLVCPSCAALVENCADATLAPHQRHNLDASDPAGWVLIPCEGSGRVIFPAPTGEQPAITEHTEG